MGLFDFLAKRRKANHAPSPNKKARGILPDTVDSTDIILIKCCHGLRPTYEIRLAAFMAQQTQRRLRIILSEGAAAHSSLTDYASHHGIAVEHFK